MTIPTPPVFSSPETPSEGDTPGEKKRIRWLLPLVCLIVVALAGVTAKILSDNNDEAVTSNTASNTSADTTGTSDRPSDANSTPDTETAIAQFRDATITGDNLLPFLDPTGDDLAIGQPAPRADGETFTGEALSLPVEGKGTVIVFLAHWCPHCQRELPRVVEWLADNPLPDDVALVGVATGTDRGKPNYPPSEWIDEEGLPVPVLADSRQDRIGQAFGLTGFPYFVAIDANGTVVKRASGEIDRDTFDSLITAAQTISG